jgi:hypothetical protein
LAAICSSPEVDVGMQSDYLAVAECRFDRTALGSGKGVLLR